MELLVAIVNSSIPSRRCDLLLKGQILYCTRDDEDFTQNDDFCTQMTDYIIYDVAQELPIATSDPSSAATVRTQHRM